MKENSFSLTTNRLLRSVLIAGLIAGTMDATGATVAYLLRGGENPIRIWNYVASGVFGSAAIRVAPYLLF